MLLIVDRSSPPTKFTTLIFDRLGVSFMLTQRDGVKPDTRTGYQATYNGLNVKVNFTGEIRLVKDFIYEHYVHWGFQKPTAFKTVLDITLRDGHVVEIKDRSKDMEKKRGEFKRRFESGEPDQLIEEAFSLDMKLE